MNNFLEIKYISPKKGKGVFTKKNVKKGTIVEVAHVILLTNKEYSLIQDTIIDNYTFEWDDPKRNSEYKCALPLSMCQFVNHSYEPNLKYQYDYEKNTIEYFTIRHVRKGEELTANYNGRVDDNSPVWFEVE